MTDEQLRELALATTPGPWEASERIVGDAQGNALCMTNLAMPPNEAAALTAYIAAANPATILALLDEIAALRADAERYRWLRDNDATIVRNYTERRGYRKTYLDAPYEVWDEFTGYTTSRDENLVEPVPTMDAAIDRAALEDDK